MKVFTKKIVWAIAWIFMITHTASCQEKPKEMEWKYIDFDKIPGETLAHEYFRTLTKYKFSQILTYNKDVLFLLGDDSGETGDSAISVIYRTKDFGDTWDKTSLGKGNIVEGIFAGNDLFVVLENNKFIDTLRLYHSTLFLSNDKGNTWKEIKRFEGENIYEINFHSKDIGIATFGKEKGLDWIDEIRYTQDGGKSWNKVNLYSNDFRTQYNCEFISKTVVWFIENNNKLMQYDLFSDETKQVRNLTKIPNDMKLAYIRKDRKTNKLVAYYFGKEQDNDKIGLYYLEEDQYIPIPDKYYIETYGDYYYGLLFDRPFSTYVWSSDRGKTWNKEKLDYMIIHTDMPSGYYGEGYIYIESSPLNIEKRGTQFTIGHPIK